MKLGLIGTGPQAQRYLDPKNNGGRSVVQLHGRCTDAEFREFVRGVDAVVIATHPVAHHWQCLAAIDEQRAVLVEKPLALTLGDCMTILNAAKRAEVPLDVAHTHIWHPAFPRPARGVRAAALCMTYAEHHRDYSVWLDWGPHLLSMLLATGAKQTVWRFEEGPTKGFRLMVNAGEQQEDFYGTEPTDQTPMSRMVNAFLRGFWRDYDFNRRVYRALFSEEHWPRKVTKSPE